MRVKQFHLLLLAAAIVFPSRVWAWGCEGHEVVALVAERHLSEHARTMSNRLLRDHPIAPSLRRYCKEQGLDAFADASTWADDYRNQHPETADWHFIDIPRGALRSDLTKYCRRSTGCITDALKQQIEILRLSRDPRRQAEALRFVIHFAGDIHQPLHTTTNNDRGGNCVPVIYFSERPELRGARSETYSPNLHSVWDVSIIRRMLGATTVQQLSDQLDRQFEAQVSSWQRGGMDIDGWAWESHEIAEHIAYGDLPRKISIERPALVRSCADDGDVAHRMFLLHERLESPYQSAAAPAVAEQLTKAGIRLAMILNHIGP
jgi:S1/P1 Nuclease